MNTVEKHAPLTEKQQSRRNALKVVGVAALTVPVIETLTGRDLLNVSAQAQTVVQLGLGGPIGGSIEEEVS